MTEATRQRARVPARFVVSIQSGLAALSLALTTIFHWGPLGWGATAALLASALVTAVVTIGRRRHRR